MKSNKQSDNKDETLWTIINYGFICLIVIACGFRRNYSKCLFDRCATIDKHYGLAIKLYKLKTGL